MTSAGQTARSASPSPTTSTSPQGIFQPKSVQDGPSCRMAPARGSVAGQICKHTTPKKAPEVSPVQEAMPRRHREPRRCCKIEADGPFSMHRSSRTPSTATSCAYDKGIKAFNAMTWKWISLSRMKALPLRPGTAHGGCTSPSCFPPASRALRACTEMRALLLVLPALRFHHFWSFFFFFFSNSPYGSVRVPDKPIKI